jgi:predicted Zn-dependent peptidase
MTVMIDRTIAPLSHPVELAEFIEPEIHRLDNGITVYAINAGSQELAKIELIFDAGSCYQDHNFVAGLSNAFMGQGSALYSAQEIAETFDSRGAYLNFSADQHFGTVNILTLNKHLEAILDVAADVVKRPTFPEMEVNAQIAKRKQQFVVENSKVKILAQKAFSKALFGDAHPYANTNSIEDFDLLSPGLFRQFHQQHYTAKRCRIVVAGLLNGHTIALLNRYFGGNDWGTSDGATSRGFVVAPSPSKKIWVERPDSMQSAIRVGALMPNRSHPDFFGLSILTTLFGGYFGSRLMANIREDKGYTYGIGASVVAFPNEAYLTVSSEVGKDVCRAALDEVYHEMVRLQDEPVPDGELEPVRAYLLGEFLRSFDGIFALSGSFRTLLEVGLDYSHYLNYLDTLKTITSAELQSLAQKYYSPGDMFEVVAGPVLNT